MAKIDYENMTTQKTKVYTHGQTFNRYEKITRLAIKKLREINPKITAIEIAEALELSSVTVGKILGEIGSAPQYPIGETAKKVIKIRESNLCADLQDIANKVGVTRERVRQILKRANLPTRHYVEKHLYECLNCGKPAKNKKYCSRKCNYEYTHPWVECDYCHKLFRCHLIRRISNIHNHLAKHEHLYCSKKCQGLYVAAHYGFIAHPENAGGKRKYDYALISKQATELHSQGLPGRIIASRLNMTFTSFQSLMHKTQTKLGPRHNHKLIKEQATVLHSQGLTYSQIAKQLHISASHLYKIIENSNRVTA